MNIDTIQHRVNSTIKQIEDERLKYGHLLVREYLDIKLVEFMEQSKILVNLYNTKEDLDK